LNWAFPSAVKPLLRRSPLFPGESLASFVARLAVLSGYSSLSILERLLQLDPLTRRENLLQLEGLKRLAQLSGASVEDLWSASDAYLVGGPLPLDDMGMLYSSLTATVRSTRSAWYCPRCLIEAAFHRLIWRPVSSAACLKHACLLMSGCPKCRQPVSVYDIVRSRCCHCYTDLRTAKPLALSRIGHELNAQRAIQSWHTGGIAPRLNWPDHPPETLCRLADGLALGMIYLSKQRTYPQIPGISRDYGYRPSRLQQLSPSQLLFAYSLAIQCMVDWPQGFRRFLYWCEPNPKPEPGKSLQSLFTYLAKNLWNNNASVFIWDAFHAFEMDRLYFLWGRAEQQMTYEHLPAYANSEEAARILGISQDALSLLVEKRSLTPIQFWHGISYLYFFHRDELRNLSQYI
jgi:hypothetical protein